jgi:hypothetical protein
MRLPRAYGAVLAAVLSMSGAHAANEYPADVLVSVTIAGERLGDIIHQLDTQLGDGYIFAYEAGELGFRRGPHLYIEPMPTRRAMDLIAAAYDACVRIRDPEITGDRTIVVFRTCEITEGARRVEEVLEGKRPRVLLGVHIEDGQAAGLSGTGARGARVLEIGKERPAAKAGIVAGDIIVSFGGEAVSGGRRLVELVQKTQPGDVVQVVVVRGAQPRALTVQF